MFHAPVWSGGPETTLSGVWARRPEAARAVAEAHGARAVTSFDELLESSDAVAFCVPPDVQSGLAIRAAEAGRHLVLEKPIADTLRDARALADTCDAAGIGSLVMFTSRFSAETKSFLERAGSIDVAGARAAMLTPAFLDGPFAQSAWRRERGALLDVGPHVFDLLTAAVGPIERVHARGTSRGWLGIHADHHGGAASDISISCSVGVQRGRFEIELFGPAGAQRYDVDGGEPAQVHATIRSALAAAADGRPHTCDVHRGLDIQHLIDAVERSMHEGRATLVSRAG
ncbi:Gfo/Idh/MocA family oxidoreductase [Phytoactinopolyspora halotolerans]|uniref:Gfo/Idh/MocA family oxidoreductase n=2 Tax=Phytoactinopolyspora halotolerans TaxID=1981512 RepID=A0A6L9SCH0_9ACTN|nr:Gfo/Idh/MocA family oxidoreductase [Phytoactinopolyspora halotolerans]